MRIQLLSDLHLEAHPDWQPTPAPGADLLVLAGDIGSYQSGSGLRDADFGLARFSPLHGWPTPVLFVPGNHEYDALDFDATHERLRQTCERLNITWLEREVRTLTHIMEAGSGTAPSRPDCVRPVRFVGTTLWSDFDALGPGPDAPPGALTQQLRAREKAFRATNFYLKKAAIQRHGELMLAPAVREQGLSCQAWLAQALAQPFAGLTVVVTHFAPSLHSADPRYGRTPGTAGFCNALDPMLSKAQLWLHGHLHCPNDYYRNGCRVLANPMGYARKDEQGQFNPVCCIDLDTI